jgi:hypothetical protein
MEGRFVNNGGILDHRIPPFFYVIGCITTILTASVQPDPEAIKYFNFVT